ncbi:hypothetical protein QBC39DRAFT_350091, partial [Podospora conica]
MVARRIARACQNKRFFITEQGSLGLAPAQARERDILVMLPAGPFPMFLRPTRDNGHGEETTYRLIGEGFLYGWQGAYKEPLIKHHWRTRSCADLLTEFVV